jgi:pimeloyl-ACP methyl ester carboxylesterase
MPRFQSGGVGLAYEDIAPGADPIGTVVLVHGFASNRTENWRRLGWYAGLERAGYRTVALDLRGHGESEKPHDPAAYARETMAADVIGLMDHLAVRRAHLVGYSMGAHLALAVALAAPERVDRLVLGGVGGRMLAPEAPTADAMTLPEALLANDPEMIADPIQRGFRRFAEAQGDDREALAACAGGRGRPPAREALASLAIPTLIAAGASDALAGDPEGLAGAIPGAKAVTIPACDHFSAIPHALLKTAVFDFLEGWDDEGPVFE